MKSSAILFASLCLLLVFAIPSAADATFSGTSFSGDPAGVASANTFQFGNTLDANTPDFYTGSFDQSELDVYTHVTGNLFNGVTFGIAGSNGYDGSITVLACLVAGCSAGDPGSVLFGFPDNCCQATIWFGSPVNSFDVFVYMFQDGGTLDGSFNNNTDLYITAETPEPASMTLMALGAAALKLARRKKAA